MDSCLTATQKKLKKEGWDIEQDLEEEQAGPDLEKPKDTDEGLNDFGEEEATPIKESDVPDWSDEDNLD